MYFSINGINWRVKMSVASSGELSRSNGSIALGVTDRDMQTIYLSNSLRGDLLYKVLCHEVCHAYIFSYGYYMTLEEEERMADFVAMWGRQVIGTTDGLLNMISNKRAG